MKFLSVFLTASLMAFSFIFCVSPLSFAQELHSSAHDNLVKSGKLFTITMFPKDNLTTFQVVGKTVASVKMDDLNMTATIKVGEQEKVVSLTRENSQFVYKGALKGSVKVKVTAPSLKDSETFLFLVP